MRLEARHINGVGLNQRVKVRKKLVKCKLVSLTVKEIGAKVKCMAERIGSNTEHALHQILGCLSKNIHSCVNI